MVIMVYMMIAGVTHLPLLLLTMQKEGATVVHTSLFCIAIAFLLITEVFPSWIFSFVPHIFFVFTVGFLNFCIFLHFLAIYPHNIIYDDHHNFIKYAIHSLEKNLPHKTCNLWKNIISATSPCHPDHHIIAWLSLNLILYTSWVDLYTVVCEWDVRHW